MINDDRFILGSLENWEFGVDNTGDLMEPTNLEQLVARCRQLGDVHLLTADGSIDCQVGSRELCPAYIFQNLDHPALPAHFVSPGDPAQLDQG